MLEAPKALLKMRLKPFLPHGVVQILERQKQERRMRTSSVEPEQAKLSLESRSLFDLFPGIENLEVSLPATQFYRPPNMVLPLPELLSLAAICRLRAPQRIFEIGTYLGFSTALMAQSTPDTTQLWTLDLDEARMRELNLDFEVGQAFGNSTAAKKTAHQKITQLRGASQNFDFSPFKNQMDLVFVDADHSYPSANFDSGVAFELLAPGGIIIWDDYVWGDYPECAGVARALSEWSTRKAIYHLEHTRLAIYLDS